MFIFIIIISAAHYVTGANDHGQLGIGTMQNVTGFTQAELEFPVDSITCGIEVCVFKSAGQILTSGTALHAVGTDSNSSIPQQTALTQVSSFDVGATHAVYIINGSVFTSGLFQYGNSGRASIDPRVLPAELPTNRTPTQVGTTDFGTYVVYEHEILQASTANWGICSPINKFWCSITLPITVRQIIRVFFSAQNIVLVDQKWLYWGAGSNSHQQLCGHNTEGFSLLYKRPLKYFAAGLQFSLASETNEDLYYCGWLLNAFKIFGRIAVPEDVHILDFSVQNGGAAVLLKMADGSTAVFGIGSSTWESGFTGEMKNLTPISTISANRIAKSQQNTVAGLQCGPIYMFNNNGQCEISCNGAVYFNGGEPRCVPLAECGVVNKIWFLDLNSHTICLCKAGEMLDKYEHCTLCRGEYEAIDSNGQYCITGCKNYIYLLDGRKLCGDQLTCGDKMIVDEIKTKLTCGKCEKYAIGTFCVAESCQQYFTRENSCRRLQNQAGNCYFVLTEGNTCRTQLEGCSLGKFEKDKFCVSCDGIQDFVLGFQCVSQCIMQTDYIFSKTGLKICNNCSFGSFSFLQENGYSTVCDRCNQKKLSSFCVESCFGYYNSSQCYQKGALGNCYLSLDFKNTCLPESAGCTDLFIENFVCVPCQSGFIEPTGKYCIQQCKNYVFSFKGHKMCIDAFPCNQTILINQGKHSVNLTCVSCFGVVLNNICINLISCQQYFTAESGCKSRPSQPNCDKPVQYKNTCFTTCPKGLNNSMGMCEEPKTLMFVLIGVGSALVICGIIITILWRRIFVCFSKTHTIQQETAIDMMRKYNVLARKNDTAEKAYEERLLDENAGKEQIQ